MAEKIANPRHIAIIMDGNGRWATQRGLTRLEGHHAGFKAIHDIVRYLDELKIEFATFYAFSTENWNRPQEEVKGIFRILRESIKKEAADLHQNNVHIRWLGREEGLSPKLLKDIEDAVSLTKDNSGLTLCLALNYGGRQEIVDAARRIVSEKIPAEHIDEKLFESRLYTEGVPEVDLLIRTAGEQRISNFLLWQSAYAEFYFTPVLWPDFTRQEMDKAILAYCGRQRRFGGL
ncbi:MAG: polyprenyl diphosphate synthase [Dehalococcoidales bacterium]|jgi:undecaprenyl diphosphate synthase